MRKLKLMVLTLTLAVAAFTASGCGDAETENETATIADDAGDAGDAGDVDDADDSDDSDDASQEDLDALADALNGTCWVGMDATDYTCYALAFADNEVNIINNADESLEGYWGISEDEIVVFEDEDMTSEVGSIPWSYDEENDVMVLNENVVMAQVDGSDLDSAATALEQYATAAQVAEALNGTVWAGLDDTESEVMALGLKDGECYFAISDTEGNISEVDGTWNMDYDNLYIYDENDELVSTLEWNFSDDVLVLTDEEGSSAALAQVDAADVSAAIEALLATIQ